MYLSRLILNPRSRRVQKEIANPYQMHRTLMNAFPDALDDSAERVLFRVEAGDAENGGVPVLVQSWSAPDWLGLESPGARDYLLPIAGPNPAVKAFDLALARQQNLVFRLRANPTARRNGKRVGLYHETEQLAWIERKGEQGGFRILAVRTNGQQVVGAQIRRQDTTHRMRFLSIQFDGVLVVVDPDLVEEAVRNGVGSGKGLGFGLLSLAPASR